MRYMHMFGLNPFQRTVDASELLNAIYSHTNDEGLVRDIAESYLDAYETAECESCGFEVPCVEIDDALTCMLCKATVRRVFVVTFTFSVTVKASNEDEAISYAEDHVDVNVDEDERIESGYDLEADHASEQF